MLVTYLILGITIALSLMAFNNRFQFNKMLFNAYLINTNKEWWRFFTHAFVHVDYLHLAVNMYSLYLFGEIIEHTFVQIWGPLKGIFYYVLMYAGGIMLSSYPSFEKHKNNPAYNAVGASGAVSAVVFSFILIYPTLNLRFLFIPIDIPAFVMGAGYLYYSWFMSKKGMDNIGHDAHFWGALFGIVYTGAIHFNFVYSFVQQIKDFVF